MRYPWIRLFIRPGEALDDVQREGTNLSDLPLFFASGASIALRQSLESDVDDPLALLNAALGGGLGAIPILTIWALVIWILVRSGVNDPPWRVVRATFAASRFWRMWDLVVIAFVIALEQMAGTFQNLTELAWLAANVWLVGAWIWGWVLLVRGLVAATGRSWARVLFAVFAPVVVPFVLVTVLATLKLLSL